MNNIKRLLGDCGIIKSDLYVVGIVPISLFKGDGSFWIVQDSSKRWYGYRCVLLLSGSILWVWLGLRASTTWNMVDYTSFFSVVIRSFGWTNMFLKVLVG